jgi:hypothetical protein
MLQSNGCFSILIGMGKHLAGWIKNKGGVDLYKESRDLRELNDMVGLEII